MTAKLSQTEKDLRKEIRDELKRNGATKTEPIIMPSDHPEVFYVKNGYVDIVRFFSKGLQKASPKR